MLVTFVKLSLIAMFAVALSSIFNVLLVPTTLWTLAGFLTLNFLISFKAGDLKC